jgi:hypothetical protein
VDIPFFQKQKLKVKKRVLVLISINVKCRSVSRKACKDMHFHCIEEVQSFLYWCMVLMFNWD